MNTLEFAGFTSSLDNLLKPIAEKLQLSPSRHQNAETRYRAVGDWLDAPGSPLAGFRPQMYPQGSLAIGTTVKPLFRNEFDLDFVVELQLAPRIMQQPLLLLDLLECRLRAHGTYSSMVERKNRCVRLVYADQFHMDILPAVPAQDGLPGCLKVPDMKAQDWKDSNPKGFAQWFINRGLYYADAEFAARNQQPLPVLQTLDEKNNLQCAVQLIKRWRDMHFLNREELAPVSIVLTTLAGRHYRGENSVQQAVTTILNGIVEQINSCPLHQRLVVLNPANPKEDLSERWSDPDVYQEFVSGIKQFQTDWQQLCSLHPQQGLDQVTAQLKQLFGENPTAEVLVEFAQKSRQDKAFGRLNITVGQPKSAGLLTVATGVGTVPSPCHTFYGDV